MMTYTGLSLIILAWAIQLLSEEKDIKRSFILVYSLGAVLLSIDGFITGLTTIAIFNTVSFVIAFESMETLVISPLKSISARARELLSCFFSRLLE